MSEDTDYDVIVFPALHIMLRNTQCIMLCITLCITLRIITVAAGLYVAVAAGDSVCLLFDCLVSST